MKHSFSPNRFIRLTLVFLGLLQASPLWAIQESLTMETQYTSPSGDYRTLRTTKNTSLAQQQETSVVVGVGLNNSTNCAVKLCVNGDMRAQGQILLNQSNGTTALQLPVLTSDSADEGSLWVKS